MTSDPLTFLLVGVVALTLAGAAFAWLVRVYRTPTGPERVVALLLLVLIVESALYANPNDVPAGIFHPGAGGLSFRIFDVLVPLCLLALAVARRRTLALPLQVLLWTAFLLWWAVAAVAGLYEGNSSGLVAFHAKAIIYLGTFALVAAVPPRRWLESRALLRAVVVASVLAALLLVLTEARIGIDLKLPLLALTGFGQLGSDAATIFVVLGTGVLCVAACSDAHRMPLFALAVPLIAAPLGAGQRAAMLGLGVAVAAAAILAPFAMRNLRVTWTEVGLVAAAALGVVMLLVVIDALRDTQHTALPFADQIKETFGSRGKQLSEQDRVNQWEQARALIAMHPWFGWGLGKEYDFYSPGFFEFMRTDLTHNIAGDLLLRTGVVGLLLFLSATAASVRDGVRAWLRERDPRVAALGLACACSLMGMFSKGMVESLFEKYRLAILIGALGGVSVSLATARAAAGEPAARGRTTAGRGALAR